MFSGGTIWVLTHGQMPERLPGVLVRDMVVSLINFFALAFSSSSFFAGGRNGPPSLAGCCFHVGKVGGVLDIFANNHEAEPCNFLR